MVKMAPSVLASGLTQQLRPISRDRPTRNRSGFSICTDEVAQAGALSLWKSQGAEILFAETVIDSQFIPWLESNNDQYQFQRVDAELDEA